MLVTQKRPRVLKWFHAGPLLFGDWGTSRLYVLGLAFYYTGHASPLYLAAMSVIMAAVAWAYTVICRCFPDGGGVYAAARQISPTLAVIGASLLLCDYIVTASLSCVEGFHYFGVPRDLTVGLCIVTIAGIGVINWLGARNAGVFALVIAVMALVVSALIGLMSLHLIPKGLATLTTGHPSIRGSWQRWGSLVQIVLALSGVESVANMTGLMTTPVARTAKRTIWPVLAEVVILNMIFGVALNALPALAGTTQPDYITFEVQQGLDSDAVPEPVKQYRDTAVRDLAIEATTGSFTPVVGPRGAHLAGVVFGTGAAIVFGLLLLSAVNTAVMAMVSVKYSMAQDQELPRILTRLNYSGVPWVGLVMACALPAGLLLFYSDPKALGQLYAIGVVGAITINVLSCAFNRKLDIGRWERLAMWVLGVFMAGVELTLIVAKHQAAIFAGSMILVVLGVRYGLQLQARRWPAPLAVPAHGWLAELELAPVQIDPSKPRIMLAARGRAQAEFAVDLARKRGATLFAIFVRTLRVMDVAPGAVPRVQDDPDAMEALGSVAALAHRYGVPFVPIYVCSPDIADEILDYTVTFGCDTLIMGKTRRSLFARRLEGDVVTRVAEHLPSEVALITRNSSPYPMPEPPAEISPLPPRTPPLA